MSRPLRVGLSTCPNDTFLFHALLEGRVPCPLDLEFTLTDIEELNEGLRDGRFDVAKVSYHAALLLHDRIEVLPVGSALGRGVGPVLLGAPGRERLVLEPPPRVLAPGRWTTAALLLRILLPELGEPEHVVFSEIQPALREGKADYGVAIHEGRFTWRENGLEWVRDLGALYEDLTRGPIPLGGLVASLAVPEEVRTAFARAARSSLEWALEHREECLPTLRRHAQETSDEVLWAHVELYVNERTLELGAEGRAALEGLAQQAERVGVLTPGARLRIHPPL